MSSRIALSLAIVFLDFCFALQVQRSLAFDQDPFSSDDNSATEICSGCSGPLSRLSRILPNAWGEVNEKPRIKMDGVGIQYLFCHQTGCLIKLELAELASKSRFVIVLLPIDDAFEKVRLEKVSQENLELWGIEVIKIIEAINVRRSDKTGLGGSGNHSMRISLSRRFLSQVESLRQPKVPANKTAD